MLGWKCNISVSVAIVNICWQDGGNAEVRIEQKYSLLCFTVFTVHLDTIKYF